MKRTVLISVVILSVLFSGFSWTQKEKKAFFSGQIESKDSYIGSKVGGRVHKIIKQEGDFVKAEEAILFLENEEYLLKAQLVKARFEQANAQLSKIKSGYQKEDVAVARADFDTKKAALDNALKNYERQQKLLKDKATTPQNEEEALSIFLQAKAQKEASQKRLELYTNGYRIEEVMMAEEALKEAKANVDLALLELKESTIVASVDGRIEKIAVQQGDLISKNQAVVQLSQEREKYAKFFVPETLLHTISLAQKVNIRLDGSEKIHTGEIFFIAQNAEFTPKNISTKDERQNLLFAIKAKVEDEGLKRGMFIEVSVP
jgi:HlyD family secretion protein